MEDLARDEKHPNLSNDGRHTTEDVVSAFTRKVANRTYWGTFFIVLPLAVVQAYADHWLMAAWLSAFCVYSLMLALFSRHQGLRNYHILAFVTMLALATAYSTYLNGVNGFLWGFPVMASIVFLLKRKLAIYCALAFFILISLAVLNAMPASIAWRGILSLAAMFVFTVTLLVLLERMQRSFTKLATTDTLTGLYNRKRLKTELEQVVALFQRNKAPVSVIICDIDWFKPLNDQHGHLQGDRLLTQAAATIKASVRQTDKVFRVGGEEFLVLLADTDLQGAYSAAEKVRQKFARQLFKLKGTEVSMTLSAGVAQLTQDDHWTDWLERADKRLYLAKENGRNRVVID
ncbi:GGDEF domain-containing protein [Idiomarina seosinensis]|uniref:GGDEF domain-containing protein n=1 Tax=Idiomarina seosinensis TaxID=281739 RepID=UPI00384C6C05